jgi:hypothetical protein
VMSSRDVAALRRTEVIEAYRFYNGAEAENSFPQS